MAGLSLSGLASGVDTASIVDQLMALERQSLTKIGYRKAAVTGQQDALKEVASKLNALKDAALALSAGSTWAQKQTAESSDPTRVAVAMLCLLSMPRPRSQHDGRPANPCGESKP